MKLQKWSINSNEKFKLTCIWSGRPVESILEATFTALPQISYWGFLAPITPATTGPILIPEKNIKKLIHSCN